MATWQRHAPRVICAAAVVLTLVSVVWLGYETWRLLWQPQKLGAMWVHPGGLDLQLRWEEIRAWFSGQVVYGVCPYAVYPPASYSLMWPFLGWVSMGAALAGWTVTAALSLAWLVRLAVRESEAVGFRECWFVAVLPLSMYATGAGIGNGQVTIHALVLMLLGIFLLERGNGRLGNHLVVSLLVLGALVKPSLTAPFFWIMMFTRGGWRPSAFVVVGYLALTLVGASYQDGTLPELVERWIDSSTANAVQGQLVVYAVGTTTALAHVGLGNLVPLTSVLILAALGAWLYWQRKSDLWLRLGVAAIATRFWTLHLWYDDLLFLLPMVALLRLIRIPGRSPTVVILLALLMAVNVAPGGLFLLPHLVSEFFVDAFVTLQVGIWLAVLIFLMGETLRSTRRTAATPPAVPPPLIPVVERD